jgi:multiple antibiotic resistance protein
VLGNRDLAERRWLAGKVALYAALVLLVSLWAGSYVLNFFGISLGALRVGGGLVVASSAWRLLNRPEEQEARKEQQAAPARLSSEAAFYPLTIPLTTGPGTISVMVALAAERPAAGHGLLPFMLGMSAAALLIAAMIWISYRYSDAVLRLVGNGGARVLARLVAFLLLCIGTQIVVTGVEDLASEFLASQR